MERITVFGAGHVGLTAAACLAAAGHCVRVIESDPDRLAILAGGGIPLVEPGLDSVVAENRAASRMSFAGPDELRSLDAIVVVAVGTPADDLGGPDLTAVDDVIELVVRLAARGSVLVMKSTVPPGTGARLAERLAEAGVAYVANPEFLREGSALTDWREPDRIVLGGERAATDRVAALYAGASAPIVRCDVASAELIKYASNAFLATKISFANEIAALCDLFGGDSTVVGRAVGLDRRIGSAFLEAGLGYGGSCFPKDTRALDFLASRAGHDFELLKAVITVNARQRLLPIEALRARFGRLQGIRVAVLGLAFKPNTDDRREAPSAEIISRLADEGASVIAFDPVAVASAESLGCERAQTLAEAVRGAQAIILATEWPEFVEADWPALLAAAAPRPLVFDGRNALAPEAVRGAGADYRGIGRR